MNNFVTEAEGLTVFDPSEHLDDAESQADLLRDALDSGHAGYIADAIGAIARARGMTDLAKGTGIPRGTLDRALAKNGNPTLETPLEVLEALNLKISLAAREPAAA